MNAGEKLFEFRKHLLQVESVLSFGKEKINRLKSDITVIRANLDDQLNLFKDTENSGFAILALRDFRALIELQNTNPTKLNKEIGLDLQTDFLYAQFNLFFEAVKEFYGLNEESKELTYSSTYGHKISTTKAIELLSEALS
jgi:hypothetical protein